MKLKYSNDLNNNEILEDEDNIHQVMMEWEKPYMKKCIEILEPSGSVLEIGFGMGYSAQQICSYDNVKYYTVIECCPEVWNKFEEFKENMKIKRPELDISIIKGRWQDVLVCAGKYDTFFFDDYSYEMTIETLNRFNNFLYECLTNHTFIGSKFGLYSTKKSLIELECTKIICHDYNIEIPTNCKYARGNKMFIPIITKIKDCEDNLKEKLLHNNLNINLEKIKEQITKNYEYNNKQKQIYCNLMIIDNFYINAIDTRNFVLTLDFKVRGNYPGQRTESYANENLKTMIEGYIQNFAGKITKWPTEKEAYNGAFQYTISRDRTWIHTDGWNNWAGVLYLTPNAPITSGTGIYRYIDGTRTTEESEVRGNKNILDNFSQDYTKWELVDRVGNIFNRLVLFNSKQYHASLDYIGTTKENGRLFQVFFFSTEK